MRFNLIMFIGLISLMAFALWVLLPVIAWANMSPKLSAMAIVVCLMAMAWLLVHFAVKGLEKDIDEEMK